VREGEGRGNAEGKASSWVRASPTPELREAARKSRSRDLFAKPHLHLRQACYDSTTDPK
jgi:hypothetical protein